jgi:D-alanyl-D-alanine carboxypeptidase (penicillin-binding protein 5/6)
VNRFTAGRSPSFFLSLCLILFWIPATSATEAPPAPAISAEAWLLVDHDSGRVLAEHNADKPLAPASLSKLMTAYLLFEKLKSGKLRLDEKISVNETALNAKGARLFLRPGEAAAVEDMLKGMIALSANDATVLLAEHVSGSEKNFVAEMNAKARAFGMNHTVFANATGHDADDQYVTARDLSRLASVLIRDFPDYYKWFALKEFTYRQIKQHNHNALLWRDTSIDGLKTGQTRSAGYGLIASGMREHMRLIAIVLGAKNENARVEAGQKLIDYGFRHFETRLLYATHSPATRVRVWLGDTRALPVGVPQNLYLTLPRGAHEKLRARLTVPDRVVAPVSLGQKVGLLTLDLDQQPIAEYPLVALQEVGPGNLLQRSLDNIQLWLQ